MPVAAGSTPVTAIYHGSTLIADLRHASQQITIGSGATVPDAPTNVGVTVSDLSAPDAPTGVGVVASEQYDDLYDDVVLLLQDSLTDESPAGRTITYNGTAGLSTDSKVGTHSISSPAGNANYVSMASSTDFGFGSGDFTLECWFKYPNAINVAADLIMLFDFRPTGTVYVYPLPALYVNSSQLLYYVNGGIRISATQPPANTWHHVAVCRISGTTEMFLNGVSQGTWADTTNYTSPSVLRLGYNQSGSASGAMLVDSVRVTKGVGRYPSNFTPPTTAFPTSAPPQATDPYYSDVVLLLQDSLTDESPQGQTLTVAGNTAVSTVESKFGSSISFDGSGDWITAAPDSSLVFGVSPFTVEFFMYWDGTVTGTPWMGVVGAHDGYGVDRYGIFMNANGITHYIQTQFPAVSAVPANQWVHIASTRDSSGVCRFFIDGVLKSTVTDTGNLTATHGFRVGNDFNLNRPPFSGYLDEIRVTKGVARYTSTFSPPTTAFPTSAPAPTVDQDFSDVVLLLQDSLSDESLQGQAITTTGNAAISTSQVKVGTHSLAVPSVNDYFEVSGDPSLEFGTGDFTVECWLHMTGGNANQRNFFDFRGRGGGNVSGRLVIFRSISGLNVWDGAQLITGSAAVPDNQWLHIACTRESGHLRLFLDGTLYGENASHTTSLVCDNIVLGGTNSTIGMTGYFDGIRITKGVARYTANFSPPTAAFPPTNGDPDFADVSLLLQDSLTDESLQGQTIVVNGNTQIDTSVKKYGTGSISMQATGDTLQMTVDSSLDFSGQFTVEAWVRTTTSSGYRTLWGHRRSSTSGADIFILFFDTSTTLKAGIISDQFSINASSILDGDWHHVAMVRDSTHLRLYLDGVEGGSVPSSAAPSAIGLPFYIGTDQYYTSRNFIGHMDDIRITNGVARYPGGVTFTPPTAAFPN